MATIKIKRGSGLPTGLTAYEPAWDTTNNRLFIHDGSTAMWIGARILNDSTLGGAGSSAFVLPTQLAVKTYVDSQVGGGAVSSLNGATGVVSIFGGTGITVNSSAATKGITIGVNSNVALLDTAQTFTAVKNFSAGISATGISAGALGITLSNAAGTITLLNRESLRGPSFVIRNSLENLNADANEISIGFSGANIALAPVTGIIELDSGRAASRNTTTYTTGILFKGNSVELSATFSSRLMLGVGQGNTVSLPMNTGILALTNEVATSVDGVTGAVDLVGGSGILITNPTGNNKGITIANNGVLSVNGTTNQITASGTTGAITLTLPAAITTPGSLATTTSLSVGTDLTVTGNLTVNGTTTTVNSNTVTINDPVIAIGGAGTTNAPPPTGDVKDRGIVFQWNNGLQSATGFFGHDRSTGYFTYIPDFVTLTNDVVSGTAGTAEFSGVRGLSGITFTLTAPDTVSSIIRARGGASYNNTAITLESANVDIGNGTTRSAVRFLENGRRHSIAPFSTMTANRTYDLPDHSGVFVVPSDLGSIAGYILTSQGATAQPVWIKPDDVGTGITASAAKLLTVSSDTSDTTCFLTFVNSNTNSNQAFKYNSNLSYNAVTNYLEVNIDGGVFA